MISEIIGHGSLRLESQESFYNIIKRGTETNGKMFGLLEFIRLESCSMNVMKDFSHLLSEH
jgi:hypothetical protein